MIIFPLAGYYLFMTRLNTQQSICVAGVPFNSMVVGCYYHHRVRTVGGGFLKTLAMMAHP